MNRNQSQEVYRLASTSPAAGSRISDISSLHHDEDHGGSREVFSPQDSSAAQNVQLYDSDSGDNQRTSNVKRWSRIFPAVFQVVNKRWLLEWMSCLVALIFLAATITILSMYNNRQLPDWP